MISRDALNQFGGADPEPDKSESAGGGFDMPGFLALHGFKVLRKKPWASHPGGTIYELDQCPFNPDPAHGSASFTDVDGVPGFTCKHNGCSGKTIKDVFANYPPERPSRVEVADEWPAPAPLGGVLLGVESFVAELLPASFRRHVMDVAERMQVPPGFPGSGHGCLSCRRGQPPRHDPAENA